MPALLVLVLLVLGVVGVEVIIWRSMAANGESRREIRGIASIEAEVNNLVGSYSQLRVVTEQALHASPGNLPALLERRLELRGQVNETWGLLLDAVQHDEGAPAGEVEDLHASYLLWDQAFGYYLEADPASRGVLVDRLQGLGEQLQVGTGQVANTIGAEFQRRFEAGLGKSESADRLLLFASAGVLALGAAFGILRMRTTRAEFARAYAMLAAEISDREEAEREAQEARRVAEAATAAKSRFLANMSHEIRTPMNGVIGLAQLLRDSPLDPDQKELVDTINRSGESLLSIINDILDFSKIESGRMEIEAAPFDLYRCVEGAVDTLAAAAEDKGLLLVADFGSDVDQFVVGDVVRVRQVLVNLLSNAVKFTEAGEVVVRVDTERRDDATVRLQVSVSDTGIGIDVARVDRLFESFTQEDSSTTRCYGGTGLGLSICRQLCRLMGGDIGVDPRDGGGSRFTFTIECVSVDAAQHEGNVSDLAGVQECLAGRRVFVSDRDATVSDAVVRRLRAWGMDATTGGDAAGTAGYDAVLVGLGAEVDEAATLGRLAVLGEAVPVIVMAPMRARRRLQDRLAHRSGALGWIARPPRFEALRSALEACFGTGEVWDGSESEGNEETGELRILVAEDNVVNQKVAQRILQRLGHDPDVVGDGRSAVEAAAGTRYDVVFMDLQMPELDGIDAAAAIRAGAAGPGPWIVALTANVLPEDRERCRAAGMADFVSKPIMLDDIRAALKRAAAHASRVHLA